MGSAKKIQEKPAATILNIVGETPVGDILLQSTSSLPALKESLAIYLANSLKNNKITIQLLQDIINAKAQDVDELKALTFESNQRVGELITLVSIVASANQYNQNRGRSDIVLNPAWQKPGQGLRIQAFTNKESWDGFMYELHQSQNSQTNTKVAIVPVEIKSLMINPSKEKFTDLNELLKNRMLKYSKHFQTDGAIGALLILPYMHPSSGSLTFNLKDATESINNSVNNNSVSIIVFLDIKNEDGETFVSTMTYFVQRNPLIANNGNIEQLDLYKLKWCKY